MKELLKLLRKAVNEHLNEDMGICDCVFDMKIITEHQPEKVVEWLEKNLPPKKYSDSDSDGDLVYSRS